MGLQLNQIKAQTNLMNAEAAKAYAEANKVKGIDTKKTEKDIEESDARINETIAFPFQSFSLVLPIGLSLLSLVRLLLAC